MIALSFKYFEVVWSFNQNICFNFEAYLSVSLFAVFHSFSARFYVIWRLRWWVMAIICKWMIMNSNVQILIICMFIEWCTYSFRMHWIHLTGCWDFSVLKINIVLVFENLNDFCYLIYSDIDVVISPLSFQISGLVICLLRQLYTIVNAFNLCS